MSDFSGLHFQDLICGVFSLRPLSTEQKASFAGVVQDFSYAEGSRTLRWHEGENYVVVTNSPLDDCASDESRFACFVGHASGLTSARSRRRGVAEHFLLAKQWNYDLVGGFLESRFAGAMLGPDSCRLIVDYFGKKKLFYKQVKDSLFFSNEFRGLCHVKDPAEGLDRQALRDFLSFGAVLGDSTLSSTIKSVPLQHYIEFDRNGLRRCDWSPPAKPRQNFATLSPAGVYETFGKVLSYYREDLGLFNADLTGGTDTRLNFAAARDLGLEFSYNFDSDRSQTEMAVFYDHEVIKILRAEFQLELQEDLAGPYRSNRRLAKTKFDYHRQFEGDMYVHTLSGLFGGEFFGGWSAENFNGPEHEQRYREMEAALAKDSFWHETVPPREKYSCWLRELHFADAPFLASLYLTYGSAAFDRWENPIWLEPYYLTNRKFSCFLADGIIRHFDLPGVGQQLAGYSFYGLLYRECLPDYLRYPFYSGITKALAIPGIDIKSVVPCPWGRPDGPPPMAERGPMDAKIHFLGEWASQTAFVDLFARETRPLSGSNTQR